MPGWDDAVSITTSQSDGSIEIKIRNSKFKTSYPPSSSSHRLPDMLSVPGDLSLITLQANMESNHPNDYSAQ